MRAIIFCFFSFLLTQGLYASPKGITLPDSVRRPPKGKVVADTTGRFIRVNRIFIVGNRITKDQIILRELTLKPGDVVYNTELPIILDLDQKKLINTRLFNKAEIKTLEFQTDQIDLLIDVDERWYTFPAPIFELADRNFNEWWANRAIFPTEADVARCEMIEDVGEATVLYERLWMEVKSGR